MHRGLEGAAASAACGIEYTVRRREGCEKRGGNGQAELQDGKGLQRELERK